MECFNCKTTNEDIGYNTVLKKIETDIEGQFGIEEYCICDKCLKTNSLSNMVYRRWY